MLRIAVCFSLLLSFTVFASSMNDQDLVSSMGTKTILTTKIGIEVPAGSQPAFIQLNSKTGKRELVSKLDTFKPHCAVHFAQTKASDILTAETVLYPRSFSTSVDDHYRWGELHVVFAYSRPATDLVCQGAEGKGQLTVGDLKILLSPYFELEADSDAR